MSVPLVWAAGEKSFFDKIGPAISKAFRYHGCSNVTIASIPGSDHYVANDQPEKVADLIRHHASPGAAPLL